MRGWEGKDLGDSEDSTSINVTVSLFKISSHIWFFVDAGYLEFSALGKRLILLIFIVGFP